MGKMDLEKANYIIRYYFDLMTVYEKAAFKHQHFLGDGLDQYKIDIATKTLKEHGGQIQFNICPKCGKLARTPMAKQCRYCYYDWHNKLDNA